MINKIHLIASAALILTVASLIIGIDFSNSLYVNAENHTIMNNSDLATLNSQDTEYMNNNTTHEIGPIIIPEDLR